MNRAITPLLFLALACSSTPAPAPAPTPEPTPAPTPDPTPKSSWPAHLDAIAAGSSVTLAYEDDGKVVEIVANATTKSAELIELAWSKGGKPFNDTMPTRIEREGDAIVISGVTFSDAGGEPGAIIEKQGDVTCYTDGPEPNAGDCQDVCFATICFHAQKGLVHLSGNWAPLQFMATHIECSDKDGPVVCQ